jgi:hypothetical protein
MPREDRTDPPPEAGAESEVTLRAFYRDREIFSSTGEWLHPLFELEEFLNAGSCPRESVLVEDKIVGKAAALLLVRLGIRRIRAGLLSSLARAVLERYEMEYEAAGSVERIDCRTEILLSEVEDPEEAYRIVKARAGRSGAPGGSAPGNGARAAPPAGARRTSDAGAQRRR